MVRCSLNPRLVGAVLCLVMISGACIGSTIVHAQTEPLSSEIPDVLILLDMSGSMDDSIDGERKIDLAARAVDRTLVELSAQGTAGAVVGFAGDCWEWPPASLAGVAAVFDLAWEDLQFEGVSRLSVGGRTPTGIALLGSLYRLGVVDDQGRPTDNGWGTIVLVSDGASNGCVDPCAVATEYGAGYVTVHTVGFVLAETSGAVEELACIADTTGGVSVNVDDFEALQNAVTELARLSGSFVFHRVQAAGNSLDVSVGISSNLALSEAYLRIEGVADLLGEPLIVQNLGNLKPGVEELVSFRWRASACDSLSDAVSFTLGGRREAYAGQAQEQAENRVHVATVEDILLLSMTDSDLRRRCSGLASLTSWVELVMKSLGLSAFVPDYLLS